MPSHEIIDGEAPLVLVTVNTGVLANRVELVSGCLARRTEVSSHPLNHCMLSVCTRTAFHRTVGFFAARCVLRQATSSSSWQQRYRRR